MGYSEIGELFPTFIKSAVGVVIKRREKDMVLYLLLSSGELRGTKRSFSGLYYICIRRTCLMLLIQHKDKSNIRTPESILEQKNKNNRLYSVTTNVVCVS